MIAVIALAGCGPDKAPAPAQATHAAEDVPIVAADPNAPEKPPTPAGRASAAKVRREMAAELPKINAAALLLENGYRTENLDEIHEVFQSMQALDQKLTLISPGPDEDEWPRVASDAFQACSDTVGELMALSVEPTQEATVDSTAERYASILNLKRKRLRCVAWAAVRRGDA